MTRWTGRTWSSLLQSLDKNEEVLEGWGLRRWESSEGSPKPGEDVLFKLNLQEQNLTLCQSLSFDGQYFADAHSRFSG